MTGRVERDPHAGLMLVLTCPRCGLDAGDLDPEDPRPIADVLREATESHECP